MRALNKWTRILHRWLSVPFVLAIIVLIVSTIAQGDGFQLPGWLSGVAIGRSGGHRRNRA